MISPLSTRFPRRTTINVREKIGSIDRAIDRFRRLADAELDKINTELAEMLRGLELRKRAYYVNMPHLVYVIGRRRDRNVDLMRSASQSAE